jgi:4,5-dihydroxyphthalate decarboxylase
VAEPLDLTAVFETYGHTRPIKEGRLDSPRLRLSFVEPPVIQDAFGPMLRDLAYDLSEMAILSFLPAFELGKPLALLPILLLNSVKFYSAYYNAESGIRHPRDLEGRRVGVRRYSQVTGTYVRGLLQHEFGVRPDRVEWCAQDGAQLDEWPDPPNVVRSGTGRTLEAMLLAGDVDAAIVGRAPISAPQIQPLFPDAARLEREWIERRGAVPVNHLLCLRRDLLDREPWLPAELLALFKEGKQRYLDHLRTQGAILNSAQQLERDLLERGIDPLPLGLQALRPGLDVILQLAYEQRVVARRYSPDELFDERVATL